MNVRVKLFGITKDIVASSHYEFQWKEGMTVEALKTALQNEFPAFSDLRSLMVAVNNQYAKDELVLTERDEIALIPPVSGG